MYTKALKQNQFVRDPCYIFGQGTGLEHDSKTKSKLCWIDWGSLTVSEIVSCTSIHLISKIC